MVLRYSGTSMRESMEGFTMANNWGELLKENNYKTFIASVFCGRNDMDYLLDGNLLNFSDDYKYSVDYVVANFTDGNDKYVLQMRFGTNGCTPHSFEEICEDAKQSLKDILNQCTGAICRIRKNHTATYILGHGYNAYQAYNQKKSELEFGVSHNYSFGKLVSLFDFMEVWELKFMRTRAYNSVMRELIFTQDHDRATVLDFLLLTEKRLNEIHGIGEKSIEEILSIQKKVLSKYSGMSLNKFRERYYGTTEE